MALRLHADECVDMRIVSGRRRRGVDISCALEDQLLGESDDRQLVHAADQGRVVVTSDTDFLRLAHQLLEDGRDHPIGVSR